MKRIDKPLPKYVANGDKERARKRKESFKRNKRNKKIHKQRISKVRYEDRTNLTCAPYYDPFESHVHNWKRGTIQSGEDGREKFFRKNKEEYTGNYCGICHLVKKQGNLGMSTGKDRLNDHTQMLIDSMTGYISDNDEKIEDVYPKTVVASDIVESIKLENLTLEPKFDIRSIETFEELFIIGEGCKYYCLNLSKTLSGIMVEELDRDGYDRFIRIRSDNGNYVVINSNYVFPEYKLIENEKLVPVGYPPKRVDKKNIITYNLDKTKKWESNKHSEWNQLWKFYKIWRSFQMYLKSYLPEESQFWMSFTDSEIYNHEKQQKLRSVHDWNEKSKIEYEQYKKDVMKETRKRPFFIPREVIPTTYYKIAPCYSKEEDKIIKDFNSLHISKKKRKVQSIKRPSIKMIEV